MPFGTLHGALFEERLKDIRALVAQEETTRALARLQRVEGSLLAKEERVRVLLLYCWVYLETQDFPLLDEQLRQAEQLDPDNMEVRLLRAHHCAHTGQESRAVREAAAVARASTVDEHAARAYLIVGLALYRSRHFTWALQYSERAQAFFRWSDNRLLVAWSTINLGLSQKALGHPDLALATLRSVRRSLPATGYPSTRLRATLNEGVLLLLLGEIPLARRSFLDVLSREDESSPLHQCLCLNNVGHTYRMQGQLDVALEYYQQSLETARAHRFARQECISLFWIGETFLDSNDMTQAREALLAAQRIATRLRHGGLRQEVLRRQAELHRRLGRLPAAQSLIRKALQLTKSLSQPRDRALLQRTELLVRGRFVEEVEIQELMEAFRQAGDRYEFARTVLLMFEHLLGDHLPSPFLAGIELEARYYMTTMGLDSWRQRLEIAARGFSHCPTSPAQFRMNRDTYERREIVSALALTRGNASKASELLGIGRNTLTRRIRTHRIDRRRFSGRRKVETGKPGRPQGRGQ